MNLIFPSFYSFILLIIIFFLVFFSSFFFNIPYFKRERGVERSDRNIAGNISKKKKLKVRY